MAKKSGRELAGIAKNMVLGSLAGKNKVVKTVDATPDWVGLVPLFMDWIQNGNAQQYEEAKRSLMQMAKISDSYRKNKSLFEASPDMYETLNKINTALCDIPHEDSVTMRVKKRISNVIDEVIAKANGKEKRP